MIDRDVATIEDLLHICRAMREDEQEQFCLLSGHEIYDHRVAALHFANTPGIAFVLLDDGRPFCAGGYTEVAAGVWQSWMVGTDAGWEQHWRAITRHSRQVMDSLFEHGAHRLQTNALADRALARRWYERGLGMQYEGTLRQFVQGRDVVMYARLKEG
jgi:hypothetical protein